MRLTRSVQCEKCPWKKSTNPHDIPNGYSVRKHRALQATIANGDLNMTDIRAMACHESPVGKEDFCLGWLFNQLGPGNNIGLRLAMRKYDLRGAHTVGPQHERFKDTLPEGD